MRKHKICCLKLCIGRVWFGVSQYVEDNANSLIFHRKRGFDFVFFIFLCWFKCQLNSCLVSSLGKGGETGMGMGMQTGMGTGIGTGMGTEM